MNLRKLYPQATDEELEQYEENTLQYLGVIWRIYQRIRSDPAAYAQWRALKDARTRASLKDEDRQLR